MKKRVSKNPFENLFKTVSYVYRQDKQTAIIRDVGFVLQTALDMVKITIAGLFLDATADVLLNSTDLTLTDFFYTQSFQWLGAITVIWIVNKAIGNYRDNAADKLKRLVSHRAKVEIMKRISTENLQEVEQDDFQALVTFVPGYSVDRIFQTYEAFVEVVRFSIRLVTSSIILYQTMGLSVFFLILIAIPEPVVQYLDEKRLRNYRMDQVEGIKFVNYLMNISLQIPNFPELRVDGIYKYLIRKFRAEDNEFIDGLLSKFKALYSDQVITSMIGQLLKNAYVVFVLLHSVARRLTIGDFKALYDYTGTVYSSAYNFARQLFVVFDNASYTREFFELIEYPGFGDGSVGTRRLKKGTPRIELKELDFQYPDDPDIKVLEDVSVVIEPGEKVAFVGGDGSGKSSLVKTLCGLYEIMSGDYVLDGLSIRELKRGELKSKVSVIFQNFVRYNFSIKKNITISGEKIRLDRKLYDKVKRVSGVSEFMTKEGLSDEQILGKFFSGGREISPGYWQRLAIARMLYRNRSVNVMDEPFTYIDGLSQEKILKDVIKYLGKTRTLIYISQNTDHLDLFDTVYYIHNGKVVESGTYSQLLRKKGKFYKEAMANR